MPPVPIANKARAFVNAYSFARTAFAGEPACLALAPRVTLRGDEMGYKAPSNSAAIWRMAAKGLCCAACTVLLAACSAADEPAGEQAAQGGARPTIVSLNPCLDAILADIADPAQVLALSHYSRDPASSSVPADIAARFGVTGGTAEEIAALGPDLVVASSFIAPATKTALEKLGLQVETFGSPGSLEESLAQIKRLSALAERVREGRALTTQIMREVPVFAAQPKSSQPQSSLPPSSQAQVSALLWQPGQIVAGDNALVWEHLARFGLTNHAGAMGLEQADQVSLEAILADPPQLLLVAGGAAGQTHPMLQELGQTRAVRFEPQLFYCGGPSMMAAWQRLEEVRLDFVLNPPGSVTHDEHRHAH